MAELCKLCNELGMTRDVRVTTTGNRGQTLLHPSVIQILESSHDAWPAMQTSKEKLETMFYGSQVKPESVACNGGE